MPDLLVVVLDVDQERVAAALADVDRPGAVLRDAAAARTDDLSADAAAVLASLDAHDLAPRLLALAVAVAHDLPPGDVAGLRVRLGDELSAGWALPAALPVLLGRRDDWAAAGASTTWRPVVAGAVLAAARSVGAHAHLPRTGRAQPEPGPCTDR